MQIHAPSLDIGRALILGGGVAGLATGYALAQRGWSVEVLERSEGLGTGASGRNAGMGRQAVGKDALLLLARDSLEGYRSLQGGADGDCLRSRGSLLLRESVERLESMARRLEQAGVPSEVDGGPVPAWLEGCPSTHRLWTPSDASLDAGGILETLRRRLVEAGGRVRFRAEVQEVLRDGLGAVSGLGLGTELLEGDLVVDARGALGGQPLPGLEGSPVPALAPMRRHLALGLEGAISLDDPWVWDLDGRAYVRPEPGGALLCVCDQEQVGPDEEGMHSDAMEWLAQRWPARFPALANTTVRTCWAGLRTFAPDKTFVLGPDASVPGLVWAAALGGHGMTTGYAVGQLVAQSVESGALPPAFASLAAARFADPSVERLHRRRAHPLEKKGSAHP